MRGYPECIAEVSTRYKSTAAERRMWGCQRQLHQIASIETIWLHHCSILYTVKTRHVTS